MLEGTSVGTFVGNIGMDGEDDGREEGSLKEEDEGREVGKLEDEVVGKSAGAIDKDGPIVGTIDKDGEELGKPVGEAEGGRDRDG